MRPLHIVLPTGFELRLLPRHLGYLAAVLVAIGLLSTFVHLLHESMAQGSQWQAAQARQSTDDRRPVHAMNLRELSFRPARLALPAVATAADTHGAPVVSTVR